MKKTAPSTAHTHSVRENSLGIYILYIIARGPLTHNATLGRLDQRIPGEMAKGLAARSFWRRRAEQIPMGLTCRSRRHHFALARSCSWWCFLLVIVLGWQHPSRIRAILHEGGRFQHGNLGEQLEQSSLANAEVVGDLEIFTRVEEAAGHTRIPSDASLPHGREVRVSFDYVIL